MTTNANCCYLIRDDTKTIFELGTGTWRFALKEVLSNKLTLLEALCEMAALDSWDVKPTYILWLRDKLLEFASDSDELRIVKSDSFQTPDGYTITGSRYGNGGMLYIEHVQGLYGEYE